MRTVISNISGDIVPSRLTDPDIWSLDDFTEQCVSKHPAYTNTRPQAIPLGKARTGEHVSALYHLCAKHNITPSFEYTEPSLRKFWSKLFLDKTVVEDQGLYASKKEAKEAVAEKGCNILRAMPHLITRVSQNQQRVSQNQQPVNWIGLLLGTALLQEAQPRPLISDFRELLTARTQNTPTRPVCRRPCIKTTKPARPMLHISHAKSRFKNVPTSPLAAKTRSTALKKQPEPPRRGKQCSGCGRMGI